ncbi:MAG: PQQ-binding-like beta-propeller repeat protein [Bythopirellula sp.]|nr:PQQ-binding-like beta-propeller repeat protein [Bythopirellula sp.]
MNTSDFLDILEQRRLVSATVVSRLREKAALDPKRLTSKAVLKYLVKKELIDHQAARELLETTLTVSASAESSILGVVPLPKVPTAADSNLTLVTDDEEIPTLTPVDSRQNLRLEEVDGQMAATSSIFDDAPRQQELPSSRLSGLASFSSKARDEASLEELLTESQQIGQPKLPKQKSKKKKRGNNEWDSGLILYGGGGLLLLLTAGVVIYYLLNRENADVVLQEATNYFEGGSYTQAINQYEKFVTNFKGHPDHSSATVKLGLARLWKDTSSTSQFAQALQTARTVLEEIEDEEDFRSAQRDLASLLPKIAQGLANQAEETSDMKIAAERVEQTRDALSLCMNTKYIPKEFRDEVLLDEVEQTLMRVERNREQSTDLAKTMTAIQEALAARDIAAAYNLRTELLELHPALMKDESLAAKVAEIAVVEVDVVEFTPEKKEALQGERPSPLLASLTLAERSGGTAAVEGNVAIRVGGAIYGLQASDGALLWRHYVGVDPRLVPLALPGGDFLFTDAVHQELVRLNGTTGKSVWRLPLSEESLQPVISGEQVYIAQPAGRMVIANLSTGEQTGFVTFGQGLATPPTVDVSGQRIYLLGEHSSLYTLSSKDFACLGVFYLGHPAGGIDVPLVKILSKLAVVVNKGLATSQLLILATDEKGLPTGIETETRLTGTVDTPLLDEARRLVVVTSLGQIAAFDVANAAGKAALSEIANREAEKQGSSLARFALLHEGNIWIGDNQINKLSIQATSNNIRLSNLENDFAGDTFNYPLQVVGDVVIHVRRPAGQAGSIVGATNISSGQSVWQTELAVPLAGAPAIDPVGGRISAITATGAAFELDREALARRIQDQAVRLSGTRRTLPTFTESVSLGQGRIAAGELGAEEILHFRPGAPRGPLELLKLPGALSGGIVAWREGFVAPTSVGQVYFLNAEDGQQLATPFQPPLETRREYPWLAPAVYGSGETAQLVLSDGKAKISLVEIAADPQPHLAAVVETNLDSLVLNTPLAVSGEVAACGTDDGALALFQLPALKAKPTVKLGGQVAWGPFAAGDGFLLATDNKQLIYVKSSGEVSWQTPLEKNVPAGTPLMDGENAFIAWQEQGVSRVLLADGNLAATTPLDQAVVAGPVALATRLVLVAADGTLLVINRP